ncbi:hypothetical protein KL86PLE_90049 [uncultured Pleomorphomonas sp.]|uniref:Uncharacterized protein n=1 Tax=uncultured Pleomorphomonas sp. TaxID=442121 RepID=A0A212LMG6_9HYPH|nr:hypothetical protein KL86PLE_90049 [uncultured Pleomorphomonas sp.]
MTNLPQIWTPASANGRQPQGECRGTESKGAAAVLSIPDCLNRLDKIQRIPGEIAGRFQA